MDELARDFLLESYENLDQLERDLVVLEEDPAAPDTLASVFRTIHTIKGSCGFLGFGKLESVTHAGESLLVLLRDRRVALTPDRASGLLALVDAVRAMLGMIETGGHEGDGDYDELIRALGRLRADDPPPAAPAAELPAAGETPDARASVTDSTIRVDLGVLDRLMNLVGELVLVRNQIVQCRAADRDTMLLAASQRLDLVTTELQESVMKTRMQPVGNLWSRFPRVVRDVASACGKRVDLEMEGHETELDRTILEAIRDPLTHLVRNAIDHGIEPPDVRLAAGKPAEGRLVMRAFHEGGQVNIEVSDDGRGIDPEQVRQKAVERRLITPEQATRMGRPDLLQLIFVPGFSTADTVTHLSGRGVGMDVVRTNVERIGGAVDVRSAPGAGTTIRMTIPLTLAIIAALVVRCGGDAYAIPEVNLLEVVLAKPDDRPGIEQVHGAPVYRLRGRLLPLIFLERALAVESRRTAAEPVHIVVLQAGDLQFGLVVDAIVDTAEILVKPLSRPLASLPAFAGATILGDGRVALILDVLRLAQRAHLRTSAAEPGRGATSPAPAPRPGLASQLLLVDVGRGGRRAISLAAVARIERIPAAALEWAGAREVVQYHGAVLPLVRLVRVLGDRDETPADPGATMPVLIHTVNGRSAGVVVDRIVDVVEEHAALSPGDGRPGVLGTAVIRQRVTDVLDLPLLIQRALPGVFDATAA